MSAAGAESEIIRSTMDNTDLYKTMRAVLFKKREKRDGILPGRLNPTGEPPGKDPRAPDPTKRIFFTF